MSNFQAIGLSAISMLKRSKPARAVRRAPFFEQLEERCVLSGPGQPVQPGVTLFPLAPPDIRPYQILTGPDGNLWFNEVEANRIGTITTTGDISSFTSVNAESITAIAVGPDGA